MMKAKGCTVIFLICCFFIRFDGYAQQTKTDSLLIALKQAKEDTNKVNILNSLAMEFRNNNPDTAIYYCSVSLPLAKKINFKEGEGESELWWGTAKTNTGEYNDALQHLKKAILCLKNKKSIARTYNNIGNIYESEGNYPLALKNYFLSLKLREETKDKLGIASSYNNIGNIYHSQDNDTEALKNYLASLKNFTEIDYQHGVAAVSNNIGNIYFKEANYSEALKNYFTCLRAYEKLEDKNGIAYSGNNIGNVYHDLGNYKEALKYYLSSLKLKEELGDKEGIAGTYGNIGNLELKLGKAESAKKWQQKALALALEIGAKETVQNCYSGLEDAETKLGNHLAALKNYKLYIVYRDSLINENNTKKSLQTSLEYEFDKKETATRLEQEKKDVIALEEKQKQRIILSSVIIGLILLLVFTFFVLNRFRITRKQKRIIELQKTEVEKQKQRVEEAYEELNQQNEEISAQRDEIEKQKILVEVHQKEIHDSINYAERIQRAMLASNEILNQNLSGQSLRGTARPDNSGKQSHNTTAISTTFSEQGNSNYFIFFQPKDVVSGDFYWASETQNNKFILVTADSTGHGVPGAIMSMLNMASLKESVKEGIIEPAEILNNTRKLIIETLKNDGSAEGGKDGMDCSALLFDFEKNKILYAAANNPVWLIRKIKTNLSEPSNFKTLQPSNQYELLEFSADKMPVGKHDRDNISFKQDVIDFQKGDVIYALTDGFPDQFGGPKGKKFKYKPLKELLLSISNLELPEQKVALTQAFTEWKGDMEQVDDVAVIGIRL